MKKRMGLFLGWAFCMTAQSETFEIQHWSGSLRASKWDEAYKRGLGGVAGVETHFYWNSIASVQLGYGYFAPRYNAGYGGPVENSNAVHELDITAGMKWEFHPSSENTVYPRLGLHLGTSRNWDEKYHLLLGANAEGIIPLNKSWSILASFQPSYSVGVNDQMFWRIGLGALFDVKP